MEGNNTVNTFDMEFSYGGAFDSLDIFKEEDAMNIIKDMLPLGKVNKSDIMIGLIALFFRNGEFF